MNKIQEIRTQKIPLIYYSSNMKSYLQALDSIAFHHLYLLQQLSLICLFYIIEICVDAMSLILVASSLFNS